MGTFNASILPASTGLTLGIPAQQWTAYLSDVFASTFQSSAIAPALTGLWRLASTDFIAWRNAANDADITFSKTQELLNHIPADTLVCDAPFQATQLIASSIILSDSGGGIWKITVDTNGELVKDKL